MKAIISIGLSVVLLLAQESGLKAAVPSKDRPAPDRDIDRVAEMIDRYVAARWSSDGVIPTERSSDAEFCRRVYLAIAGRIPYVAEISDFLHDDAPDKRRRLVDALLESNGYVNHSVVTWRKILLPEAINDFQTRFLVQGFEDWLRSQFVNPQTRFDDLVTELLTTPLGNGGGGSLRPRFPGASPQAFFQAKQDLPENIAAATSRMLLGVRIECAQCHMHPDDSWTREQFWSYAAFFAAVDRGRRDNLFNRIRNSFDRYQIEIPDTETVVPAAFLDGAELEWKPGQNARGRLAEWITAAENPYFARATVNRIWGQLFGVGLVDPVDDFSDHNPPSHPELLDALAEQLVEHDYDLKFLIRAITASQTYQLSSRRTHESQDNFQSFARMTPQPLTPEQLVASLSVALGVPRIDPSPVNTGAGDSAQAELLGLFANDAEAPTERTTTILQSLALMNGRLIAEATNHTSGVTLSAVLQAPWMNTADRIETLYLAALTRPPRPEELARLAAYVDSGGPQDDSGQALADVFWVLLNSSEFLLNK